MAPSLFEPERGQPFHIVCVIRYQAAKVPGRIPAARGVSSAVSELRDDLVRLKIPAIKPENIKRHEERHDTLELWWWHQKGRGPLHNTLDKVLCQHMKPSDIEAEQIRSIRLFYLPERHESLPSTWRAWWHLEAPDDLALPPSYGAPISRLQISASAVHSDLQSASSLSASLQQIIASVEKPPLTSMLPPNALGIHFPEIRYCFKLLDGAQMSDPNWTVKCVYLENLLGRLFDDIPFGRPNFKNDAPALIRNAVLMVLHADADRAAHLEARLRSVSGDRPGYDASAARELLSQLNGEKLEHANLRSKFSMLSGECEDTKTALAQSREENEHLSRRIRSLEAQLEESKGKLSASEDARATAETKEAVTDAKLAAARSKHEAAESRLEALLAKFTKQESGISPTTANNKLLQGDLAHVEHERRKEQEAHVKERENWQAERSRMRAELSAIRAEQAKPFLTPALLNAFIGINDMARVEMAP